MRRLFSYILLGIITLACNSNPKNHSKTSGINKIIFSTGPCLGYCPTLSIEVDEKLNYKLFGAGHSTSKGFYEGKVSEYFWNTLTAKMENSSYQKLDTIYEYGYTDVPSFEVIIVDNKDKKTISGDWKSAPSELTNAFSWLENSYPYFELKKWIH